MVDVHREIERLNGMSVAGDAGSRVLEFASPIAFDDVLRLIHLPRESNAAITLHDQL